MIVDNLKDIVKHTHGLGFIDTVKVDGSADKAEVSAMATDRSVVMYGELRNPIEGLEKTVGLSRIGILAGMLNFPPFTKSDATITIEHQERGGVDIPCEIEFNTDSGHAASYRFMSSEAVEEHLRIPPFKGVKWDVVVEPTKHALEDLKYFSGVLGSYEPTFSVRTKAGILEFLIGTGPTDRSIVPFATNIDGELKHGWSWPLNQVLAVLKLASSAECTLSISDQGALKIDVDSGLGHYEYILPAKSK